MNITRKRFLQSMSGGTVVLLIQACGGNGISEASALLGGGTGNPEPTTSCGASGAEISDNHGHVLTIPSADLTSSSDRSYSILGSATHDHTVTLTAAQLATLNAGQVVTVTSTTTDAAPFGAHAHNLTVSCV
jgi:hypothetical protein